MRLSTSLPPLATLAVLLGCGGGGPSGAPAAPAPDVRRSPFVGCYSLTPGPWDDGVVIHEGIRRPRLLRLDTVPGRDPLFVSYGAETEPPVGAGLTRVSWRLLAADTAWVFATEGGWSGYAMTLALDGDSIGGRGEETSDVIAPYRSHGVRGVRIPCHRWPVPSPPEFHPRNPDYAPHPDKPTFARVTDPVSEVAGLPPLRDVAAPEGTRELRLWVGFGMVIPNQMLRIVTDGASVTGELFYWWDMPGDSRDDPRLDDFRREMREAAGGFGCKTARSGELRRVIRQGTPRDRSTWITACRVDFGDAEPDWAELLGVLEDHDVFTLPRPETLEPEEVLTLDGVSLQVEVLDGDRYRTYTYSNPSVQPWPEAEKAAGILAAVGGLGR